MEMWKGESGELNTSDPWANSLNRETVLIKREKRHYLNGPYMFKHKYPSPKVPSLIEIRPVVLEKNFINFLNVFFFFPISFLSPLGKGADLHLNKTQGCFMPSSVEFGVMVLEKNIFKLCQ